MITPSVIIVLGIGICWAIIWIAALSAYGRPPRFSEVLSIGLFAFLSAIVIVSGIASIIKLIVWSFTW